MLGSLNDVWGYSVLGMFADSFEDEVNSLYRRSLCEPVPRDEVDDLLDRYNVRFEDLPSWLHARVGEIEVAG